MRRRLVVVALATALSTFGLVGTAAPASATTCYIEEPGVDDVYCMVYGNMLVRALCVKLPVC